MDAILAAAYWWDVLEHLRFINGEAVFRPGEPPQGETAIGLAHAQWEAGCYSRLMKGQRSFP